MEGKNDSKFPKTVVVTEGYLLINDERTMETFNTLVEQGLLWEQLSVLLQEYANPRNADAKIEEFFSKLSRQMNTVIENQKSLPPPTDSASSKYKDNLVEAKSIEIEEIKPKPMKKGSSLFNKFNSLK